MILAAFALDAALLIAVALVLWAYAVRIEDVSFIDAFWGAGMALVALFAWLRLESAGPLANLLLAMTALWGLRLGIHLLRRWLREGEDKRYARMLARDKAAGRFARAALTRVFLGQALLLLLVSSPAHLGILAAGETARPGALAWAGAALWLVGIAFEWIGDWQLAQFRADPGNAGQVMDKGLWAWTRHPNYFGDACAWWGIWLVAAEAGWWVAAATVAGPIFLTFTLMRWSGAPLLEAGLAKSRPGYAAYQARTPAFFPRPPRPL